MSEASTSDPSSIDQKLTIRWWHLLTGMLLIVLLTFLTPRGKSPEFAHLAKGSVSPSKIIAPFDFEILKSQEELDNERSEAAHMVLPVVVRVDSISETYTHELLQFASEIHRMLAALPDSYFLTDDSDSITDDTTDIDSNLIAPEPYNHIGPADSLSFLHGRNKLFSRFGFRLSSKTWRFLLDLYSMDRIESPGVFFRFFESTLAGSLRDIYGQGIINVPKNQVEHVSGKVMFQHEGEEMSVDLQRVYTPSEAQERESVLLRQRLARESFPAGAVSAGYEILQPFISANLVFDSAETKRRREAAIAKVPLASGFVLKDELIIDKNHIVKPEILAKLNSLAKKRAEQEQYQVGFKVILPVIGYGILIAFVVLILGFYIALIKPRIWSEWKYIVLIALILFLLHLFQSLVIINKELSQYIFPVAVAVMLIGILVDRGVALVSVVVIALVTALLNGNDFPSAFTAILVGSIAVHGIRNVKTRADVMRVTLYLVAVYIPLVVSFHLIRFTGSSELMTDISTAGINSFLSPILVLGLVFLFENLFRITTDISLLELVDLNRPLLRELALKSPGTYHHSIMVGSLAEAAARSIGANALLTRAGAYYHDIGKIENKEYFIENQESGSENIHDRLPPSKSVELVVSHVKRGVELAEQYRLPRQINDFIIEHHGRSKLAFFYAKAKKEQGESVSEDRFRYPGPNPQSKETGILMLADTVEAATRSMEPQSNEEYVEVVDKLVRSRLSEGDLDECPLTLREITQIKDAFIQVLSGIHHQRIAYPDQQDSDEEPAN